MDLVFQTILFFLKQPNPGLKHFELLSLHSYACANFQGYWPDSDPDLCLPRREYWPKNSLCVCVCVCAQLGQTLCDPMDCSPPGSSVHGIFQARIWSGLPFPSPGDLPDPGIEPRSPALQADSLLMEL